LSASPKTPLTYSAPPDLLAGLRRPTCKGRGGKERGGEGKGKGREGREWGVSAVHSFPYLLDHFVLFMLSVLAVFWHCRGHVH